MNFFKLLWALGEIITIGIGSAFIIENALKSYAAGDEILTGCTLLSIGIIMISWRKDVFSK